MTSKDRLIWLVLFLSGAYVGHRFRPAVTTDAVCRLSTKTDRTVTVVETKRPDGTVQKKTVTKDVKVDASKTRTETKAVETRPDWIISGMYGLRTDGLPVYGGSIQYRLIGPIDVGVWGLSSGAAGVSLGIQF